MPSLVIRELNRAVTPLMTPAEVAAGTAFVGLNIDTSGGNVALITAVEMCVRVVGADRANLGFAQMFAARDLELVEGVNLGTQLPGGRFEVFNILTSEEGQRTIERQYPDPIRFDNAPKYAVAGQALFTIAPANSFFITFAVYGRIVSPGSREFPFELR